MVSTEDTPTQVLMEIEVPERLRLFVQQWSKHDEIAANEIMLSLLSHGLAGLCAVNDWNTRLVDVVAPILEDLVKCSGEGAEVLHIDLVTQPVASRSSRTR